MAAAGSLKVSDPPHYFLPTTHYALRTTKVASRRFPEPCTVLASLLRHLGVPVPDRPEGYSLEHARHAHARNANVSYFFLSHCFSWEGLDVV